jgi:hypothetical protein
MELIPLADVVERLLVGGAFCQGKRRGKKDISIDQTRYVRLWNAIQTAMYYLVVRSRGEMIADQQGSASSPTSRV